MSNWLSKNRRGLRSLTLVAVSSVALAALLAFTALQKRNTPSTHATFIASRPLSTGQAETALVSIAQPIGFEPNLGQTDPQVRFLARTADYSLFLTDREAVFSLGGATPMPIPRHLHPAIHPRKSAALKMQFLGANARPRISATERSESYSNYVTGNDPRRWISNIPQYARIRYANIYPGIDLAYYGNQGQLEFDFIVAPHRSATQIAWRIRGADSVSTNSAGGLVLRSAAGDVQLHKPVAYQIKHNRRVSVDATFALNARNEVAFRLGPYDPTRELVIDPGVSYSTFLGASSKDFGQAIAVDSAGSPYLTGQTASSQFPKTLGRFGGSTDAFITKFKADGSGLVYSTFFGGSGDDSGNAIVLDASKNVYLVGGTSSTNLPVTANAAQSTYAGGPSDSPFDAFVAKLGPTGTLLYASYAGGSAEDIATSVAVDGGGNIYAAGETLSTNFPTVSSLQGGNAGDRDGFVVKINASSGAFAFSSYLGGSSADLISGLALDSNGNIYVTGLTTSTNFPIAGSSPYQRTCGTDGNCNPGNNGAASDAFVTAIKSDLTQYIYSTYLGGSSFDEGQGIAVDGSGNAFIAGDTGSTDLKTVNPYQSSLKTGAGSNGFVAELDPTGSTAKYLTYIGGSGVDTPFSIAIDLNAQNIYLTGQTTSSDFPTASPVQPTYAGGKSDAFVSRLQPSKGAGSAQLIFSTFLGGSGDEDTQLGGVVADSQGNIYVTGDTGPISTTPFPTINPFQPASGGAVDAFLTKIVPTASPAGFTISDFTITPNAIDRGSSGTGTVTVTSINNFAGSVNLTCAVTGSGATPPKCSMNPPAVILTAGASQQATITITTKTTGSSIVPAGLWLPFPFALVGMALTGKRTRSRLSIMAILALSLVLALAGCGGGSSGGGGGGGGGTSTGSYAVTVTGNALGSSASSSAVNFSVQ